MGAPVSVVRHVDPGIVGLDRAEGEVLCRYSHPAECNIRARACVREQSCIAHLDKRLNSVDLPTLGIPTIPILRLDLDEFTRPGCNVETSRRRRNVISPHLNRPSRGFGSSFSFFGAIALSGGSKDQRGRRRRPKAGNGLSSTSSVRAVRLYSHTSSFPAMADDDISLPKGSSRFLLCDVLSHLLASVLHAATIQKLIKDYVPGDVRVSGDTVDMLVACCNGDAHAALRNDSVRKGASAVRAWTASVPPTRG